MAKTKKSSKKAKPRFDEDDDFVEDMKRTSNEASEEEIEKQRGRKKIPLNFSNTGVEEAEVSWFKPKHGKDKNYIDIIPFRITQDWYKDLRIPIGTWEDSSKYTTLPTGRKEGQQAYTLIIPVHFDVGTKGAAKLCLREAFGEKCVICDEMFDKISEDKEKNEKIIKKLRPKWRAFYNIRDRRDKDKGIQLWDISFHLFEKYLRTEIRLSDEGVTPFASLKEGKTLVFRGTQKKLGSFPFVEVTSIDFVDRKKPYKTSILDEVFSLDEMLVIPTYEDVRSAFFEEEENEEEEEREEEIDDDDELPEDFDDENDDDENDDDENDDDENDDDENDDDDDDEDTDDDDDDNEDTDDDDDDNEDTDDEDTDEDTDEEDDEEEEKPKTKRRKAKTTKKATKKKTAKKSDKKKFRRKKR